MAVATAMITGTCCRCTGAMTPYIGKGENICISCGWVRYDEKIADPIEDGPKKRGRPKGYSRKGNIRLN